MNTNIIIYTKSDNVIYRGDAPNPRDMELIEKNIEGVVRLQKELGEWKKRNKI